MEQKCTAAEIKAYGKLGPTDMNRLESLKAVPARFPSNDDSIGIEIVGAASAAKIPGGEPEYEVVTDSQNESLRWLVGELIRLLGVPLAEVFRHPQVSRKNATEAITAKWQ